MKNRIAVHLALNAWLAATSYFPIPGNSSSLTSYFGGGALSDAVQISPYPAQKPVTDLGPMPFSNAEANFYRRAWPIDKSHSIGALVLFGSVLALLLFGLIRQMAKSGPRKPPPE